MSSIYDATIGNNPQSLKIIANAVNQQLQSKLDKAQLVDLLQFARGQRTRDWGGRSTQQICQMVARLFVESRFSANKERDLVDIKEILKAHIGSGDQEADYDAMIVNEDGVPLSMLPPAPPQEGESSADATSSPASSSSAGHITQVDTIANMKNVDNVKNVVAIGNLQGFLGKTDEVSIQQIFNPQAAYRKNYIILDSRYRDTSQDTTTTGFSSMSWVFLANSAITSVGGVNSLGDVEQVVAISTGDIRIPYQNNAMINAYRRITMNINEWSGQSFIGQESRKFHFIFKAVTDGNMIDCVRLTQDAEFRFAKPITQLDRITVTFGCPLEQITFDMDRQLMAISYLANAQFTSVVPHNLQTGDQVYFSGFTTNDPATDAALIATVNSPLGYNIVVINDTVIEVNGLDLTVATAPIVPLSIPVYFGSKRIFVPIELTYIAKQTKK